MEEKEVKSRLERAVASIRSNWFPSPQPTLSARQSLSRRNIPFKGPLWISRSAFDVSNNDSLKHVFLRAVADLGDGNVEFTVENVDSVNGEWNGIRKDQSAELHAQHSVNEVAKYERLSNDCPSDVTILYVHGGGYILGSPAANRPITYSLCQASDARVFSLDYRLAPQNAFPAALYDLLLAYLSLLYPPPGSSHQAIPPSHIVLAGDSTGGALTLALVQLLLHWSRQRRTSLPFHDKEIPLSLPAGVAVLSAYCDHTDSLPSYHSTRDTDYSGEPPIYNDPDYPSCPIWPTDPPRAVAYCPAEALCHPLVSPAIASSWAGAPPLFFAVGDESVRDGCKVVAARAAAQRVKVVWERYESMPHIFVMLPGVGGVPQAKRCLREWGGFCKAVGSGKEIQTGASKIGMQGEVVSKDDLQWIEGVDMNRIEEVMRRGMRSMGVGKRTGTRAKM